MQVVVTDSWRAAFPNARVGLLLLEDVVNPRVHALLDEATQRIEHELRQRFGGADRGTWLRLPRSRRISATIVPSARPTTCCASSSRWRSKANHSPARVP